MEGSRACLGESKPLAVLPNAGIFSHRSAVLQAAKQYQRTIRLAGLYVAGGMAGGLLCYAAYRAYANRSSLSQVSHMAGSDRPSPAAARVPGPLKPSR